VSEVLNILQKQDLLGKKGPKSSTISSLSLSKLVDIAEKIDCVVRTDHHPINDPVYSYSASLGLGGSALECENLDCRISRINNLARFALMYSNRVFINSFFTKYRYIKSDKEFRFAKKDLYDDLLVFHQIGPLLQHGYISLFSPRMNICFSCQAKEILGENAGKRFDREYRRLQEDYLVRMAVECEMDDDLYTFTCAGPDPYFECESVKVYSDTPSALMNRSKIMGRVRSGKVVPISKTLTKELGLHVDKAHSVATNAMHGLTTSSCLNTTFLTEHDLHISFLNSLHAAPKIRERNYIALKHLASIVPFVADVALIDIIKLRQREEEAFILYRQALNAAMHTLTRPGKEFTEQDARELHADVIAPSLAVLEQKVSKAKRDLISKPLRSLTGVVGVISFGILTGLVPADMSTVAKAIGLVKFGADMIEHTMALSDKQNSIKSDHFYFLWKVQKKVR